MDQRVGGGVAAVGVEAVDKVRAVRWAVRAE
jgi:hypothetical protein